MNDIFQHIPVGTVFPEGNRHGIGVSIPTYEDTEEYEKGNMTHIIKQGYARFVVHDDRKKLREKFASLAGPDEFIIDLSSIEAAQRCIEYTGKEGRFVAMIDGIALAAIKKGGESKAHAFEQHTGRIPSSRQAFNVLFEHQGFDGTDAVASIKKNLAGIVGAHESDIYIFQNGMEAFDEIHSRLMIMSPGLQTVQLGLSYVDSLKVQQEFGISCYQSHVRSQKNDLVLFEDYLNHNDLAGVFTESTSNPKMRSIDLPRAFDITRKRGVPLFVDDSVVSPYNVDALRYADVLITSLTKFPSGSADVMGGALVLNRESPYYARFTELLDGRGDTIYGDDAIILSDNFNSFANRMPVINENAEFVADYLARHKAVGQFYYPKYMDQDHYNLIKRDHGGYGGLMSFVLKREDHTEQVFDEMKCWKIPGFGTRSTIACLYTLLAHYHEHKFTQEHDLSRNLIRLSVGMEDKHAIVAMLDEALKFG